MAVSLEFTEKISVAQRAKRREELAHAEEIGARKSEAKIHQQLKDGIVPLAPFIPGEDTMREMLADHVCKVCGTEAPEGSPQYEFMLRRLNEYLATLNPKEEEEEEEIVGLAEINYDDFAKVELRVCEVVDCKPIKRAKKLLELTLNDGTKTPRTVASGIAKWYSPEELIGKKVIVVANLAPRALCGVESHGMILAGEITEDDVKVAFVEGLPAGTQLS